MLTFLLFIIGTSVQGALWRGGSLAKKNCTDVILQGSSWSYSWRPFHPCPNQANFKKNVQWVPMIFRASDLSYISTVKQNGAKHLLGFNEPNAANQAAMTVQQALNAWPRLMKTGLILGSPATTKFGALGPRSWLGQFMAGVKRRKYRVDFICLHWYARGDQKVNDFRKFLRNITNTYPGYPLWITEFGHGTGNIQDEIKFMNGAYWMFKKEFPNVERYAWFTNRWSNPTTGFNKWNLNTQNGLTKVGKKYKSFPRK
mmetsp:Transcript_106332/g.129669  ORF Transcript_106332/g.129669 Transcript_106332/m.129669 type:complete len:257 (+) Transcript_106332:55-825(+)